MKKTVTGQAPYEAESYSDLDSLSDETNSRNVGLGLPSKTMNSNRNPLRNHTLLISVNGAEDAFLSYSKKGLARHCQVFSQILKI